VLGLNQQVFDNAKTNRAFYESALRDAKTYISWNEARQEEIQRKTDSLLDNQCYSNQLFVRSLRFNSEALEAIRYLKQDVNGYVLAGAEDFELTQIATSGNDGTGSETIAERLKKYSSIFNDAEVKTFLDLAEKDSDDENEGDEVNNYLYTQTRRAPKRKGTLPEQILSVLNDLEEQVTQAINNLEQNEIAAAWELAAWYSL
jgi:hypothetical protein